MEVEVELEGGKKTTNIIGGYSSDSWLITVGNEENLLGNDTCFLFNLTQNMRFNARKFNKQGGNSVGYISASEKKLKFGDTDLVINESYRNVTSHIIRPDYKVPIGSAVEAKQNKKDYFQGSHFMHGSDMTSH